MPFHQPWAGSVVSTVNVPAVTGLIEMLPLLLVTLQSPKLTEPDDDPVDDDPVDDDPLDDDPLDDDPPDDPPDDPQAARVSANAPAAATTSDRLTCMQCPTFSAMEF